MSMTKRYLESLPQSEQDAILGGIDNGYVSPDEWDKDAENDIWEEIRQIPDDDFSRLWKENGGDWEEVEPAEWARALMEEEEES